MIAKNPLNIGQTITLTESERDGSSVIHKQAEYEVVDVYPHILPVKNQNGIRRCITNADLMRLGYVI